MTSLSQRPAALAPFLFVVVLGGAFLGCKREEIKVYRIARDPAVAPVSPAAAPGSEGEAPSLPTVKYALPSGWQELPPGGMRAASFTIAGSEGRRAEVSVIPLPGVTGRDLDLVNMWREKLKLPAWTEAELAQQGQPVAIGDSKGTLVEMASEKPVGEFNFPPRVVSAILSKDDTTWFIKLTGEDTLVQEHKPRFVEFLKSISFEEPGAALALNAGQRPLSTNAKETPRQDSRKPAWAVPSGWQEVAPGPMLTAKYQVSAAGGRADVNIGTAGGGAGANISRWQNQLSLPSGTPGEAEKLAQPLDLPSGKAMLVDLEGTDAKTQKPSRLLGIIVPRGDQSWFYKFMGDKQVIEAEKAKFLEFVRSVKYPDAP